METAKSTTILDGLDFIKEEPKKTSTAGNTGQLVNSNSSKNINEESKQT